MRGKLGFFGSPPIRGRTFSPGLVLLLVLLASGGGSHKKAAKRGAGPGGSSLEAAPSRFTIRKLAW